MFRAIIGVIFNTTIGKYLVGAVALALIGSLAWGGCERNAKLKAQSERDAAQMAGKIGFEAYIKLYEDREKIKAKASQKRGKLNEWQRKNDLDSLSDDFNAGGVRGEVPVGGPSGPGGAKKPTTLYSDPADPATGYTEASK